VFFRRRAGKSGTAEPDHSGQRDRVNVGVIVTDLRGHFVEGLRREHFHILDNGMEQPLTGFTAVEEPARLRSCFSLKVARPVNTRAFLGT
jgi:hypothetical protein